MPKYRYARSYDDIIKYCIEQGIDVHKIGNLTADDIDDTAMTTALVDLTKAELTTRGYPVPKGHHRDYFEHVPEEDKWLAVKTVMSWFR